MLARMQVIEGSDFGGVDMGGFGRVGMPRVSQNMTGLPLVASPTGKRLVSHAPVFDFRSGRGPGNHKIRFYNGSSKFQKPQR